MLNDVRFALRSLRKSPGFTLVALVTLALAIGANTTMFSVVYGVLLRPLPYPQSQRIVELAQTYAGGGRDTKAVTYTQFQLFEQHRDVFADLAASTSLGFNLVAGDAAERVHALRVSREYFRVFGTAPQIGREFTADEDQPDGPAVAILSYGLWVRRFGADPSVLGQTILLNDQPFTVVGVMPAGFTAVDPSVDLWSTLAQVGRTIGSGANLEMLGRVATGSTVERARAAIQAMTASFREQFPQYIPRQATLDLFRYQDLVASQVEGPARLLFGAIAFVLLIACANVANLVLGRAALREREVAVRIALGAGRVRLIRLVLAETVLLALAGGALGLLLADWGLKTVLAMLPAAVPRADAIRLDGWAVVFTLGLSLATGLVFGALPAWRATRADVQETLREGGARTTEGARRGWVRNALVVGEMALSLVLLVGAALLMQTFANLLRTDPGFRTDHLLTAELWLSGSRYDSSAGITAFYDDLIRRLDAYPGVRSAAVVEAGLPLERGGNTYVRIAGQGHSVDYRTVTPNYFAALGVPLVRGRMLGDADAAQAEPVAVVNRTFAHRFLNDSAAVGQVIQMGDGPRRVVGIVGDVRSFIGAPAIPALYLASAQTPASLTRGFATWFPMHVVVRTTVDPASLKDILVRTIRQADPSVPVGQVRTMDEVLAGSLALQRFTMLLLAVFAALALVLAAVGIYGVMSYFAARRIHEIGVRMALGALPGDVIGLVLRRGMALVAFGAVLGMAGALALTRLLAGALYGVKTTDPLTLAGTTLLLTLVASVACYLPARRAARGDPIEALRYE